MEGKANFSRRLLSGTGIAECLEITDVGCNLKQFDMAWPDWPWPQISRQIYATACVDLQNSAESV